MPFALDSKADLSEISEAVNYLLSNYVGNVSADPNTGQIVGPQGIVVAYLYRYLSVKYADSFDGSLNFSNSPTGRGYYGVNNSNSTTESTNPADYIWYKVAGGFGTSKFLYYQTTGGRAINFVVSTAAPDSTYVQDSGSAIDLDIITSGTRGNSATTAYLVLSQSAPAPSGFPLFTSGSSLPPGWSANLGTVSVGEVAWYTFGKYNSSTVTVDGIPANSTLWSVPVAASIFQDIRSDNWNGSNPPVAGTPSTYGTAGYYIERNTGNMFLNSVYGRGIAQFDGANTGTGGYTAAILANQSLGQNIGIEGYTNNTFVTSGAVRAWNQSSGAGNAIYAYHQGTGAGMLAQSANGIGVKGTGSTGLEGTGTIGVAGYGSSGGYGTYGQNTSGGVAIFADGYFGTNNSTQVTNLYAQYANTLIGTAGVNQLRFVGGTSTGTATASFSGTNKPGSNSSNVWMTMQIDGTTVYIPVWT